MRHGHDLIKAFMPTDAADAAAAAAAACLPSFLALISRVIVGSLSFFLSFFLPFVLRSLSHAEKDTSPDGDGGRERAREVAS
jgi:hypothetical protein